MAGSRLVQVSEFDLGMDLSVRWQVRVVSKDIVLKV